MKTLWLSTLGRETLIAGDNTIGLLMVLCASAFLCIWLEQRYKWAVKISGAIIGLVLGLLLSNLGIIPTDSVLYNDVVLDFFVPMAMPLLMLKCNLRRIRREAGRMLSIFLISAVGTIAGALLVFYVFRAGYGNDHDLAIAMAAFTGTYIGGGMNFIAMCSQYHAEQGLTAALMVADGLIMAAYLILLFVVAGNRWFRRQCTHPLIDQVEREDAEAGDIQAGKKNTTRAAAAWKRQTISLRDIAVNVAYSVSVVWISKLLAGIFGNSSAAVVRYILGQQYLWITTIAVVVATLCGERVENWHGSQEMGMYFMYLFFFAVGVPADIMVVIKEGPILLFFATVVVLVNMIVTFAAAKLMHFDLEEALLASNANVGATSTAVGMSISQGWVSLVGPGMLVAILGYVIGNYAGTLVGTILGL